ncbi:MAG TPA: hypothetical protein VG961_07945 [Ignavibacteria bacterium]|nr:hypothetical protein [Ignavibacteria bacterium]
MSRITGLYKSGAICKLADFPVGWQIIPAEITERAKDIWIFHVKRD